jgi:integrase
MPADREIDGLRARADQYIRLARASNTRRAYATDWADFDAWCRDHGRESLPAAAETVSLYLTDLAAGRRPSTLDRRLVAINRRHLDQGWERPGAATEVRAVMAGIRRSVGRRPGAKAPLTPGDLATATAALPDTVLGRRNRALLLVGLAGAFRRAELTGLDWEDVEWVPEGLRVTIRRSKTDPEGWGRVIGIPRGEGDGTCPVRALERWREAAGGKGGPVFRVVGRTGRALEARLSDRAVARVVKQAAGAAGLDPAGYAGHSLRAGLATAAARAGAGERDIMRQTGHRSVTTVRRYIREGELFRDNVAARIGL